MPDYSGSGIEGLPATTAESLISGDPRVLGWLREAVSEGDRLNRADPAYDKADMAMRYVAGEQRTNPSDPVLPWLPKIQVNQSRKVVQAHVSALTDLKPLFGYKPSNDAYQLHGYLLNKLIESWWIVTMADRALGDAVKYALTAGTADIAIEWNPHLGLFGNQELIAKDWRDTLPWRPSQQRNIQLWEGAILREEHPINVLRAMYPHKANRLIPASDSVMATLKGRFRRALSSLLSPATDTLSGLSNTTHAQVPRSGQTLIYRTYLMDRTRNLTQKTLVMGDPTSNWAYQVAPGAFLYPRRRLVVATEDTVLFDGPNPYWHGMIPLSRLTLWDLPWQQMGVPLLSDLLPLQDAINDSANDIALGVKQWMEPSVLYDTGAVSQSFMRLHDARRPGAKIKLNATAGEGYKRLEGPPPQVLQLAMEFHEGLKSTFNDLSGVANLQQLLELRAMPSGDTLRQYYEAMTPELRAEGRSMEFVLRDVGEQAKVNIFQFMTEQQRLQILGDEGVVLEDFDYDPGSLVPGLTPGQPGYVPELDVNVPRDKRAQYFHKQFIFMVKPNSILAMHAQEEKLLDLQLARMGYLDFWTMMESLDRANVGSPPKIPLPPLQPPDPQEVQADLLQQMGMDPATGLPTGAPPMPGKYSLDPMTGELRELRVPQTITERLLAQQILGIGATDNPAGRKASGGSAPQSETKTDENGAPRQTVTESSKAKDGKPSPNPASDSSVH